MHEQFNGAVWRLTAWFTAILALLSLMFGSIVYTVAQSELHYTINSTMDPRSSIFVDSEAARMYRQQRIAESANHLFASLAIFTMTIVGLGSVASYFFARRVLQPIADAAEAQERFSSDAAHELKTPLTVMQTEIEVALRDSNAQPSLYRETLVSSLDEVGRLRALTERLLLLANNRTLELAPHSINDVIATGIKRIKPRAAASHIIIETTAVPETVIAHAESAADALVIVLDNAIKYSPEHSTVTISSGTRGGIYELRVKDEGEGIAAYDRPHIFERFYRADQSRTNSSVNGTGLGLALARNLMALQNGRITLKKSTKQGSIFALSWPLAPKHSSTNEKRVS